MFIIVLRRQRNDRGEFTDDLLDSANRVSVKREKDHWKIVAFKGVAFDGLEPTETHYVYDQPDKAAKQWEHFFIKDARTNKLIWSVGGNSRY
jgi:hypothetical protein